MKIALCGKGGSGKSTLTVLLAKSFSFKGYSVLVIDSDESNAGLHRKLGFGKAPLPIMQMAGGRKGIKERKNKKLQIGEAHVTTDFIQNDRLSIADIPEGNIIRNNGIALVQIGKIDNALEGCACPMGLVNRELLDKIELSPSEVIIIDTEAGMEHFGRGIETAIDGIIIIVDPSAESVDFAAKAYGLSQTIGLQHIWVVLNKVNNENIKAKMAQRLNQKGIKVTAGIPADDLVFESELDGNSVQSRSAMAAVEALTEHIIDSIKQ